MCNDYAKKIQMMISKDKFVVWLMVLLIVERASGNHTGWWTCHTACQRCRRQAGGIEDWILETYPELFSPHPEQTFISENLTENMGPVNPTASTSGCCETEFTYDAPTKTDDGVYNYTVVNLQGEFQFIPFGTCRTGSICENGTCEQMYRIHWVLVYNNTKLPSTSPVSFVPIKVPSHCECMNIGKGRP